MKIPKEWTFQNKEVADGFDAHIKEQLPWYALATFVVAHIAKHYIPKGGTVYDLGASTGNIGRAIEETIIAREAKFYPIESSKEMCAKYKGPGKIENKDICSVKYKPFDLCIIFLTLMFISQAQRSVLIANLRKKLKPGGAIIIFDKLVPESGYISSIMWRLTLSGKLAAGALPEDIIKKELSLAGIQRPLSFSELPGAVECFRFGDFCGWIIEE